MKKLPDMTKTHLKAAVDDLQRQLRLTKDDIRMDEAYSDATGMVFSIPNFKPYQKEMIRDRLMILCEFHGWKPPIIDTKNPNRIVVELRKLNALSTSNKLMSE